LGLALFRDNVARAARIRDRLLKVLLDLVNRERLGESKKKKKKKKMHAKFFFLKLFLLFFLFCMISYQQITIQKHNPNVD